MDVVKLFQDAGCIRHGHFNLASGRHGDQFVDAEMLAAQPVGVLQRLAEELIDNVIPSDIMEAIDAVVTPAIGGIAPSQALIVNWWLRTGRELDLYYAEKADKHPDSGYIFKFSPPFAERLAGLNVLGLEDVTTTGTSVGRVLEAAEDCGARSVAVTVLWNRGGVTEINGLPVYSLCSEQLPSWAPGDPNCPGCQQGLPLTKGDGTPVT